jgi:transcriptional regulator with XRE-family HTH domain
MGKKEIKDRLYELLIMNNEKPVDMAKRTDIPKSSLSLYLNGKREPRQNILTKIAMAYDIEEAWLMGFDVPMERKERFTKENAILDAKISNDPVLKEAIKKYYELNEYDRKLILDFIDYKYDRRGC